LTRTFRAAGLAIAAAAILALAPAAASANTFASPTSLKFPAQTVGTSGAPGTVTVTVTCTAPNFMNPALCQIPQGGVFVPNPAFVGADPSDFAQTNTCGNGVFSGPAFAGTATCTFSVTFKPTAAGSRAATLTLGNDATGGAQPPPISLSGEGVATGQRAAALAKCKKKHGKKKKKCRNKANLLPV
jgi:trimeric autotransporter adhesin